MTFRCMPAFQTLGAGDCGASWGEERSNECQNDETRRREGEKEEGDEETGRGGEEEGGVEEGGEEKGGGRRGGGRGGGGVDPARASRQSLGPRVPKHGLVSLFGLHGQRSSSSTSHLRVLNLSRVTELPGQDLRTVSLTAFTRSTPARAPIVPILRVDPSFVTGSRAIALFYSRDHPSVPSPLPLPSPPPPLY
uniref:Uncharacterized protein n=1 Tax=Vespula pensylvanica TaxID=30213 RepID=A0A834UH35_VESPE|nr:hypothetical protein H0235_001128 [Vespula pensylvanica]